MNTIKNKDGKVLGFIRDSGKETVALSSSGKVVGVYSSTTNLTKDGNLKIVSVGNSVVNQLFR